jgi:hypothetical protein
MPGGRAFLNGSVEQDYLGTAGLALRVMLTHQPESLRDSVEPAAGSHPARLTMRRDKRKERPLGALF